MKKSAWVYEAEILGQADRLLWWNYKLSRYNESIYPPICLMILFMPYSTWTKLKNSETSLRHWLLRYCLLTSRRAFFVIRGAFVQEKWILDFSAITVLWAWLLPSFEGLVVFPHMSQGVAAFWKIILNNYEVEFLLFFCSDP